MGCTSRKFRLSRELARSYQDRLLIVNLRSRAGRDDPPAGGGFWSDETPGPGNRLELDPAAGRASTLWKRTGGDDGRESGAIVMARRGWDGRVAEPGNRAVVPGIGSFGREFPGAG